MKKLIAKLPTLTAPMEKEELIVYLAAAREAVSAVLMTKREAKQMPVYFVSRALQGTNTTEIKSSKALPKLKLSWLTNFPLEVDMVTSRSIKSQMYTFSPMMVANSRKHHCRVRSYTREVLVISTNLDIQKNHYPLDFRNRRGDEARIKNTWYNQGLVNECHRRTLKILLRL
ncbi:reverse transcriptase domain-containing protein [Tanacetum coccineum]